MIKTNPYEYSCNVRHFSPFEKIKIGYFTENLEIGAEPLKKIWESFALDLTVHCHLFSKLTVSRTPSWKPETTSQTFMMP